MIKNSEPLSMAEISEYLKKGNESESPILKFTKKFVEINLKDAKALRKKIEDIKLIKVGPEHISKIIDLMPQTPIELNKIFVDTNLNEDETQKILEKIKETK